MSGGLMGDFNFIKTKEDAVKVCSCTYEKALNEFGKEKIEQWNNEPHQNIRDLELHFKERRMSEQCSKELAN